MIWSDVSGNERITQRIAATIKRGRLPHGCIIEGASCVDKTLIAKRFAKALLCGDRPGIGCDACAVCQKINRDAHEDVLCAEGDENSVKDEEIEALQEKLKRKPFAGERNIAIIKNADGMTRRAQNRLLKTLEEPIPGTVLLLLSENVENLEKTILSRCAVYRFAPFRVPTHEDWMEEAEALAQMLLDGAPFYQAKIKMTALADDKENACKLLDAMETVYGNALRKKDGSPEAGAPMRLKQAILAIEEARRDLRRGGPMGYTLKNLLLAMEG